MMNLIAGDDQSAADSSDDSLSYSEDGSKCYLEFLRHNNRYQLWNKKSSANGLRQLVVFLFIYLAAFVPLVVYIST
jgi:hypothetical protein